MRRRAARRSEPWLPPRLWRALLLCAETSLYVSGSNSSGICAPRASAERARAGAAAQGANTAANGVWRFCGRRNAARATPVLARDTHREVGVDFGAAKRFGVVYQEHRVGREQDNQLERFSRRRFFEGGQEALLQPPNAHVREAGAELHRRPRRFGRRCSFSAARSEARATQQAPWTSGADAQERCSVRRCDARRAEGREAPGVSLAYRLPTRRRSCARTARIVPQRY